LKARLSAALLYIIAILLALWIIFPLYYMATLSFQPSKIAFSWPPVWIFAPTFENYVEILTSNFLLYLRNSIVIATSNTLFSLVIGIPAAYGLSRFNYRRKQDISFWIISARMAPPIGLAVPFILLVRLINGFDNPLTLIALYLLPNLPIVVWMMKSFFDDIPVDLDNAALIDGCSRWGALRSVCLPLSLPGMVVTSLFSFILSMNEFIFALIFTGRNWETVTVGVVAYITPQGELWGPMTASAVVTMIPILIFALIVRKHLVRGFLFGAVKG
jgi:multiple sugar transport system permease protein